ncbi:nucleotidyltransferase domain-containing protein [Stenotrophomonas sp. ISL-67]|uniref:nucleotidyltransferase domain-containing protein n=1 Tax=Stenotrophomonas sp. ISL-67 TaxID=2819171 RepID=UPI001BECBA5B|nr:nucleotidyltransferase domain-containing protein [Stenotrophomonas sp. ISL-67]MBT2767853.1 nucleotidyltransferase domain-containing protein [Stenotrophomonas sp. ISL-67]
MSNTSLLMGVLFPATRQRVLAALLLQQDASLHLRELARITGTHAGTLARELDKLTESGLLLRSEQGNQVHYRANRACVLFDDLAAMFRKTHGVVPVLRDSLASVADHVSLAWVFGSMATGTEVNGSDVDLLVLGDLGFADLVRAIHPAQEVLHREINPVLYSVEEFMRRVQTGDAFATGLLAKPKLLVTGDKDDIGKLAGDPAAQGAQR